METRAGYMLIGTFVLFSFVGILGFFLWIMQKDVSYNVKYYTTFFSGSVAGLAKGGAVNFLGVPVGTVKEIKLDPNDLEVVQLTIAISKDIPIKEDAYTSLEYQGLTGYKFVQIYGGSKESPLLKAKPGQKYPVIASRYSGVEEIMTLLPRMMYKVTNLVDRIHAIFNEQNRNRFSDALKNIDVLSQRLSESSKPLKGLIENTNNAVQTLEREVKGLSHSTQKTLSKIDLVSDEIAHYFGKNKVALDLFTQRGFYELLQTLTATRNMVTSATRFFKKLDENPTGLFFESSRKGIFIPQ